MTLLFNSGCYNIPLQFIMTSLNCNYRNCNLGYGNYNCNLGYSNYGNCNLGYSNYNCNLGYGNYGNCNLGYGNNCSSPSSSINNGCGCGCFNYCQPSVYRICLTITGLNTYTFVIKDIVGNQIAQGTATLCGNLLQFTFLDGETTIGYARIIFTDYNIQRIGIMNVCGSISTLFPSVYQVVPDTVCCRYY